MPMMNESVHERQKRMQELHSSNNAFVKAEQMQVKKMGGSMPNEAGLSHQFDARMSVTGEYAQKFGRELTKGLDKDAFPVK
jgi:hypothetical protein